MPPSPFALEIADGTRPATPLWSFGQPVASHATVSDQWVAVASYSDGRRRDTVLSLATGEAKWSRVSTDSTLVSSTRTAAPLIVDGGYIHLERFGISDGANLQSIDADTGEVRWAEDQPRWFEAPPWQCGDQRVCAVTWDTFEGARRIVQYDSADGRLVAQGPILGTEILGDVRLVTGTQESERPPYPQPPATIPGEEPAPTPDESTPAAPAATAPPTSAVEPDGFRSPSVATVPDDAQAPMVVRFDPTGARLWQFPLSDLLSSTDVNYATPVAALDEATNTFMIATPSGAIQPGSDVVIGIDYNTGERLWTAQNRSFDCWEWMVRPDNVRCHVQGSLQTVVTDGEASLVSNSAVTVVFEAFDPRSGEVRGSVSATYPAWDGQGERPFVPSKTWMIKDGIAIESTDGLVALSTADGEVVPLEATLTAWCQNPPVDDDGEIFPGYYPCTVGEPTRTRTEGVMPLMTDIVGAVAGDVAVYVTEGYVGAFRVG